MEVDGAFSTGKMNLQKKPFMGNSEKKFKGALL